MHCSLDSILTKVADFVFEVSCADLFFLA